MVLQGESTRFAFTIKKKPVDFWLDQRGEMLARLFCETREPKRMLRFRAMELEGAEAETLYKQALTADLLAERGLEEADLAGNELNEETRLENARIHLHLARLYLDRQSPGEARQALDTAESVFGRDNQEHAWASRTFLRARLELQEGNYEGAYDRLSGHLRLPVPRNTRRETESWRAGPWRRPRDSGPMCPRCASCCRIRDVPPHRHLFAVSRATNARISSRILR
jgi:hypothetical protein